MGRDEEGGWEDGWLYGAGMVETAGKGVVVGREVDIVTIIKKLFFGHVV